MFTQSVGFVGFGKMAEAMLEGMLSATLFSTFRFYEINPTRCTEISERYAISFSDMPELVRHSDILIFCVKPQNIGGVLAKLSEFDFSKKLLISILAGTPISTYERALVMPQVLRVMPNTPALLREGASALCFSPTVTPAHKQIGQAIFESLGTCVEVEEAQMDAVTGISGSGPAFIYRLADKIAKAGEAEGLAYDQSLALIAQTLVGAGHMLLRSGKSPAQLTAEVSSPNGTTVAGLLAFDQTDIDTGIQSVVNAAISRSKELSQEGSLS